MANSSMKGERVEGWRTMEADKLKRKHGYERVEGIVWEKTDE